jgi:hypothetical protein
MTAPSLHYRLAGLSALLGVLLLVVGLGTATAQDLANQLLREVDGPYDITVVAKPTVPVAGAGSRYSVRVLEAVAKTPVTDVSVTLLAKRPNGEEAGEIGLPQRPDSPEIYEALVRLRTSGQWLYTIVVEGPRGLGAVQGFIDVAEPGSAGLGGTITWAVAMSLLIGAVLLFWWRIGRRPIEEPR